MTQRSPVGAAESQRYGVIICFNSTCMNLPDGVEQMENVVSNLRKELGKIRAGRAKPDVLDTVMVEAYESQMPISHKPVNPQRAN